MARLPDNNLYKNMKNLKKICRMLPVLLLLVFTSCKKKAAVAEPPEPACELVFPGVTFKSSSTDLSSEQKAILSSIAQNLGNNPRCKVVVTGYCNSTLSDRQRSWRRVESVILYLTEKQGVGKSRFIFKYGQTGDDCNVVYLSNALSGQAGGGEIPPFPIQ